ncbi:hypothetical protein KKF91_19180 [Myxococcota bacterium]|nr:hypothetical protein [Myxococcota bacterium]MBU1432669.1 hypothetical protein [Myxococcota bacterium]MBU1897025.1 hypothetical protein [Myxococcota bacterium]
MLLRSLVTLALLAPSVTGASPAATRAALERLEELLELRRADDLLRPEAITPAILVHVRPRYEASQAWLEAATLRLLLKALGPGSVRLCVACALPRTESRPGYLRRDTGPISLDEIIRLDAHYRGAAAAARTAIWLDEAPQGVAFKIVDLRSGQVMFAQNIDARLSEQARANEGMRLSEALERRMRGDALTHIFTDIALYPGQHASIEWADQWGEANRNLSGVVLSFYDPVIGLGLTYHRALSWQGLLVGGQFILSVPTMVAQAQADGEAELVDPLLTGVAMVRYPLGGSNYAALLSISTNGEVGLGFTLLNTSFIPVLP